MHDPPLWGLHHEIEGKGYRGMGDEKTQVFTLELCSSAGYARTQDQQQDVLELRLLSATLSVGSYLQLRIPCIRQVVIDGTESALSILGDRREYRYRVDVSV